MTSHSKPSRESGNARRLHPDNDLLLTQSIDHLFDHGFISLCHEGDLIASPAADGDSLHRMGVPTDRWIFVGRFISDQRYLLDYHRKQILL